jgi:hypothetical protein
MREENTSAKELLVLIAECNNISVYFLQKVLSNIYPLRRL